MNDCSGWLTTLLTWFFKEDLAHFKPKSSTNQRNLAYLPLKPYPLSSILPGCDTLPSWLCGPCLWNDPICSKCWAGYSKVRLFCNSCIIHVCLVSYLNHFVAIASYLYFIISLSDFTIAKLHDCIRTWLWDLAHVKPKSITNQRNLACLFLNLIVNPWFCQAVTLWPAAGCAGLGLTWSDSKQVTHKGDLVYTK